VRDAQKAEGGVKQTIVEDLVIGGGPAGAMTAIRLAHAGRPVTLVERERGSLDKVCGEFLSWEAVAYLGQVGLEPASLGAEPIDGVRLSSGRRTVEAALPFRAFSLSRGVLDEEMLARAQATGCNVRRGVEVDALKRVGDLWRAETRAGETLWARNVFLATGKHDVRGWRRGRGTHANMVGFKMHWRLRTAQIERLRGVMQLFLFRSGYGGLSLIEGGTANLCFVIRRSQLRASCSWTHLLAEIMSSSQILEARLSGAEPAWDRPRAIAPIPYGWMAPKFEGVWRVGDQAAVIPSFTGDGMSIALHSGALAAQMVLGGRGAADFSCTLGAQLSGGMRLATFVSRLMVTPTGRHLAPAGLSLVPNVMPWIAEATRIRERDQVPWHRSPLHEAHPA
jgi:menaquinone-9 beta-reductase